MSEARNDVPREVLSEDIALDKFVGMGSPSGWPCASNSHVTTGTLGGIGRPSAKAFSG